MIISGDDTRRRGLLLLLRLPWLLVKQRPRFSISGMLLVVAVAACCAAYVGAEVRRENRLREWASDLQQRGVNVMGLAGRSVFVDFFGDAPTDEDFARLRDLRTDRCILRFRRGYLDDERLLSLAPVSGLVRLSFSAEDVSLSAVQEFERRTPGCEVLVDREKLWSRREAEAAVTAQ